jgi:hypothetical protein
MSSSPEPTEPTEPAAADARAATAEYIPHQEFRNGLPFGRFRLIVNPGLAQKFVAQRLHAVPVALALIGFGMAAALAGYTVAGVVLVGLGVLLRRVVLWQAPKILLHLASNNETTYLDATSAGVMEVRRST